MLWVNYASNAYKFSNTTVADVAHKYDSLFAPADYAFAIWAMIFLFGAAFVIYQWRLLQYDPAHYIQRTGIWFAISNITNAAWVLCWINEWMAISTLLIFILLCSLIQLTIELRLELDDVPVRIIVFVWWPISVYLGWIVAASVACTAAYLVSTGWNALNIAPQTWAIVMIIIALVLYILLNQQRNMREAAVVGIWAFVAIAVRHWGNYTGIVIAAITASLILVVVTGLHAYRGRYYSPITKIKRGEW